MELYKDPSAPIDERVADLVSRMTVEEKIEQTFYTAPAIPRLGLPAHNWWNEALHGVARAGIATIFPQSIGMAASFNDDLLFKVGTAISDEARAKHHENARRGERGIYFGLSYWSPNINIFRDPRWGRGQETFGEDPHLTSRMGVAFCKALQGDDPVYFKLIATPKHYAVHSGPESLRHGFDAKASAKDLEETYLPAFKACITEAKAYSIMGAYNRTNGEACCASDTLMNKILRGEWGFEGYYVSDCGAIDDIWAHHKLTPTMAEAAALALKTGCDLNCGKTREAMYEAIKEKHLTQAELNIAVSRLMKARILLGQLDPPEKCKYSAIPFDVVACKEHLELSRRMARESLVLMKNDGLLPLDKSKKLSYAVIGPNAYDRLALEANYHGESGNYITPLDGIRATLGPDATVRYVKGCERSRVEESYWGATADRYMAEAEAIAEKSDVVLLFMGLSREEEGEEGGNAESDGGDDRVNLHLPGSQSLLVERLSRLGKPIVLTLMGGSPVDLSKLETKVNAIVNAWYPGEQGGQAIADVLFGDYSPAGRLPISYPQNTADLPPMTDYSMQGRTYRFSKKPMAWTFGYGLSYTKFEYSNLSLESTPGKGEDAQFTVLVRNKGNVDSDEVVQLYLQRDPANAQEAPIRQLLAYKRVFIKKGQTMSVQLKVPADYLSLVNADGKRLALSGKQIFSCGGHADDSTSQSRAGYACQRLELTF